jgi:hypothetical protein
MFSQLIGSGVAAEYDIFSGIMRVSRWDISTSTDFEIAGFLGFVYRAEI